MTTHLNHEVLYITPTYKIGKYKWRMIVYTGESFNFATGKHDPHNFTRYQYLDESLYWRGDKWMNDCDHPRYDGNHAYAGLPKGLAKIYYTHEADIQAALKG